MTKILVRQTPDAGNINLLIGYMRGKMIDVKGDADDLRCVFCTNKSPEECPPRVFSLKHWFSFSEYGTVACIGGTAAHLMMCEGVAGFTSVCRAEEENGRDIAAWLGLTRQSYTKLCYPYEGQKDGVHLGEKSTREDAIKFLEDIRDGRLMFVGDGNDDQGCEFDIACDAVSNQDVYWQTAEKAEKECSL